MLQLLTKPLYISSSYWAGPVYVRYAFTEHLLTSKSDCGMTNLLYNWYHNDSCMYVMLNEGDTDCSGHCNHTNTIQKTHQTIRKKPSFKPLETVSFLVVRRQESSGFSSLGSLLLVVGAQKRTNKIPTSILDKLFFVLVG